MPAPIVSVRNVSKMYQLGEHTLYALNRVTASIEKGEFVAVVGQSGSGKSTFLHVASLLDSPSEGNIIVNGQDVSTFSESERAKLRNKAIGFIFQQFNLLPKTSSLENVMLPLVYAGLPAKERERRAKELLIRVGLGERLQNTPGQLSGGQQQRVAIARALVNDPDIVFADEPTGNLDSQSGEEIKKMLVELASEGRTIVMVTHDKKLAQIAGRVITMKDGKILSDTKKRKPQKGEVA